MAMTEREREKALSFDARKYPQDMPCKSCGHRWMQHKGLLCPIHVGVVSYIHTPQGKSPFILSPPIYGEQTFIPDEMYYNQNPDFDVV